MSEMNSSNGILKQFDHQYILGDIISRGHFSTVYACLVKGKTHLACRIYKKEKVNFDKLRSHLKTIIELKHPNIIRIFDGYETETEVHFLCENVGGDDLFERIVSMGHYCEEQAAFVIESILSGLESLHSKGIVHGDIRPESLMYLTEDQTSPVKLRDVSFASSPPELDSWLYTDPESTAPSMASDIWNLGIVFYIMLSGVEPEPPESEEIEICSGIRLRLFCDVSESATNLLKQMLSPRAKTRITASEALNCSWFTGNPHETVHLEQTVERLKQFNAKRKFRAATTAVLAAQKIIRRQVR